MMTAADVSKALAEAATPERAKAGAWFFKTGKGEYGEGDVFLGVTVPQQRRIARAHASLSLAEVKRLLRSKLHEERLTALFILVRQYVRSDATTKRDIYEFYRANLRSVNNWDLVDSSAPQIMGAHLLALPSRERRVVLDPLAKSTSLWERRIAILSTHAFIGAGDAKDAFRIATILLRDEQDLIHKAVGWTLREVGKRISADVLRTFLEKHAARMPRTALRYAIEHFSPKERKTWLALS
ncbi:MAG: DNA alkylation repair protein [Polyangiaceae bacterium]